MIKIRNRNLKWNDLNMAELELTKLIVHFVQSKKAENKSPKTISWYLEMLSDFMKFVRSSGLTGILAELNPQMVREFIISEQSRGLSPFTIQTKVRAIKAFSSWLFTEGYTPDNVLSTVKLPKAPLNIVEPLTATEIDSLIKAQNPLTTIGSRDIALLLTLLDTGLRAGELCGLRSEDAHIEEGYFKVLGKGNRERIVPLGMLAQKVLYRYVFHFRPEPLGKANDYLFLTLEGKQLKTNALKLLLGRWGKKAGVPRLHAHLCRHTYATNFLTYQCGDVLRLKLILGHNTLEMVNRYVHYASSQALVLHRPSSPLDQLGLKKIKMAAGNGKSRPNPNTSEAKTT